jgi:hypothetical protein
LNSHLKTHPVDGDERHPGKGSFRLSCHPEVVSGSQF